MKVTLADGKEYYELECRANICTARDIQCACWSQPDAFCNAAPCRNPGVIYLTEAMQLKLITARLTE